jgi:hypothetical protein
VGVTGASPWLTFAVSLVGGGLTGTLVSTYVTGGRERRAARAKVRECLAETENTRWLDADYQEFRKALIRLDSAAIIARFDRALIHRYTYLAEVAHYAEIVQKGETDWLPPRTLPLELAALLESVVVMIANEAWRPRFWWARKKRYIWVIDKTIAKRRAEHPDWSWNAVLFKPRLMTKEPGLRAALKRGTKRSVKQLIGRERPSRPAEPAS